MSSVGTESQSVESVESVKLVESVESAESIEMTKRLNLWNALWNACSFGSLEAVCEALAQGADVNIREKSSRYTPLIAVCRRNDNWTEAEYIARELIRCGAKIDYRDDNGWTALHFAASRSGQNVITALLELGADPLLRDRNNNTVLHRCCWRSDDEAVRVAEVILKTNECDLETRDTVADQTPLMDACEKGSAATVELLLSRRANVNAIGKEKDTPLILAARNHFHGAAMIPLLIANGADEYALNRHHHSALVIAVAYGNADIVNSFAKLHPDPQPALVNKLLEFSPGAGARVADPIGCVRAAAHFGYTPLNTGWFKRWVEHKRNFADNWAMLRLDATDITKTFHVMAMCDDPPTWRWIGSEYLTTRHPETNETLLHIASRVGNANAVRELMRLWMNPFIRDKQGKTAIQITTHNNIKQILQEYSNTPARCEVMRWYGPFLIRRVRTFLLVAQRWRNTKLRFVSKDVVGIIIGHIRNLEHV